MTHENGGTPRETGSPEVCEKGAYPPGFEPELEGEELERAQRKERGYTWMVRIELLLLLLIAALVIYFIVTA